MFRVRTGLWSRRQRRPAQTAGSLTIALAICMAASALATDAAAQEKWVATWTASAHGPYPSGFPTAQPDLQFAFPTPSTGANDQTFRLIVRPDLWGGRMRLRFSNAFGTQPVTFDDVFLGLQASGGTLVPRSNRPVTFEGGKPRVTIPPGQRVYSDPIELSYVRTATDPELAGRKLAVSFHVVGSSGPMTWHAKAMTTSYLSAPRSGGRSSDDSDDAFPYTAASWFFLDAMEVLAPQDTIVVAALGDSISDGSLSTLNGDDRWPDFLSRRLHAVLGPSVSVVNQGIGGNQIVGPATYTTDKPYGGGPSALQRLERDVLGIAGLNVVIWMEGINDFGFESASAEAVIAGFREGVNRLHARGIKVIGATLTTAFNIDRPADAPLAHGTRETDAKRKAVNEFIRTSGVFDAVVDFDAVTIDSATGMLRPEYQPNSTVGGAGDRIHPNRAGYQAMAKAIDIPTLVRLAGRATAQRREAPGQQRASERH